MARDETWQQAATFWSFRALAGVAPIVPGGVGRAVASALGSLAYRRLDGLRAIVTANQARVLGLDPGDERVRRSARDAFRLYARYWYDTFHLPALSSATLHARVDAPDLHRLDAALARGRGCLLVLPHLGNWDVAGRFLANHGYRLAAVAENLRPARLAALFRGHREQLGIRIVPLVNPKAVCGEIERLLADNWIVALLADRALSRRGIEVEMFRAIRSIPVGPAMLSLTTGAAMAVVAVYTNPSGWRIRASPLLEVERSGDMRGDVTALSRLVAAELERAIAVQPEDWHLFQPGWSVVAARTRMRRSAIERPPAPSTAVARQ